MIIEVYHGTDHVATVDTPHNDVEDALEYAFRWTQNIDGSWSMDRNERVIVVAVGGLRSSIVGDTFVTGTGERYRCAMFGFEVTA